MPKRNLAWILVIAMITLLMWQLPQTIAGRDAVYKAFGPLADVKAQIRKRFVDSVDDSELTTAAVEAGIRAMVSKLHDPYAVYFTASEYEQFRGRADGVFGGIGVDVWPTSRGLEVLSRDANSPAAGADIQVGDIITHIEGSPVTSLPLEEVINHRLNGQPGTEVRLTLVHMDEGTPSPPREVTVERAIIQVDPVRGWSRGREGGWRFMLDPASRIGYVRITKFTYDVAERLDAAIGSMLSSGLRGLVLDLRDNTGGLLDSAREVTDRFLESGLIVRVRAKRADVKEWSAMRDGTYPGFAMAVLINGATASAAEIVAGALRDHHRAIVVGERSYGKGSVQEVVELDGGRGAIKMTTAYYYLPCGQCINRTPKSKDWGVHPTIEVQLTPEERQVWLATGRQITREPRFPTTTRSADDDSQDFENSERESIARTLLAADPQLRAALDALGAKLKKGTTPAESDRGALESLANPNEIIVSR